MIANDNVNVHLHSAYSLHILRKMLMALFSSSQHLGGFNLVYAVFLSDQTTDCEANSLLTDVYIAAIGSLTGALIWVCVVHKSGQELPWSWRNRKTVPHPASQKTIKSNITYIMLNLQ